MKNLYNITDCAKELEQMNATIEAEKPSNKHFRIYRKYSNEIEIAINKRGAMQAVAECLSSRFMNDGANSIDLKFYAMDYSRRITTYSDPDEIVVEQLDNAEAEELNATLDWLLDFSSVHSPEVYYMKAWGNGYTELNAAAYNFYAYIQHEKEMPADMPQYIPKWLALVFPYESDFVKRDIEHEENKRNRRKEFFKAFKTIFDNSLKFNIDMDIDNEKPGGIAEQEAINFVESLGDYNDFNVKKFKKIIQYCNNNFIKHFKAGNCNNGLKDYALKFGRESSVVIYLELRFKNEADIAITIDELQELACPDELDIVEQHPLWDNKHFAKIRLWWD